MSKKRKHKALPPRRKRMTREGRLASARSWLMKFSGKNVVRSYAKWFGVNLLCAVKELSLLGVTVAPVYIQQLKTNLGSRKNRRPKPVAEKQSVGFGVDWDDNFAYIAGRTAAGFPYGVTWEELTEAERPPRVVQDRGGLSRTTNSEFPFDNSSKKVFVGFKSLHREEVS